MKPVRISYPWLSTLGALALVAWLLLLARALPWPDAGPPWLERLPPALQDGGNWPFALALLAALLTFDGWRFVRSRRRYREQLTQYQQQIGELFDSRRELGTRARTYSDHADKLKMFISERLLETIEYDEKFLHFKNIASEVRHNGVISYDKAQTALRLAESDCANDEGRQQYRDAAASLLYLWDLLDLSTTDNIALHVANQIYDCEEHFFQAMLDHDTGPAPYQPTFQVSHALKRALLPITDNPDTLGLTGEWPKRGDYGDDKFSIRIRQDSELLGNENHMVLLIENLLNNALFYSQQKQHRNRYARVAITLAQRNGDVELKVYNRGPRIKDEEKDKIYQLGFSSRRVREHHGKGLGLYFVHEITRGFEGSIEFENIDNREGVFVISARLANGDVEQHQLQITRVKGRPMCRYLDAEPARRHEWSWESPIVSIEASQGANRKPRVISELQKSEDSTHLDDTDPMRPRWVLEVRNRRRGSRLVFTPLDVRGVEFTLHLPSARSRLDNEE